ncbi:MAG: copper amine oxidase N-terminal domain-containing protein [Armatimonadota bacterium]
MRSWVLAVLTVAMAVATVCAGQQYMWIDRVEEGGRLLVPLRGIFEAYGAQVGWESATQTVTISAPAMNVVMRVNSQIAYVNGQPRQLDVPPRVFGGRTYIPLRFAAETLGERVEYQGDRIDLPTIGLTLLIRGEAAGPMPEYAGRGASVPLSITSPTEGATVGPRIEVYGTAPGGSMLILETEVRTQDDSELLRVVPGIRHVVPADGNWHFAIAAPTLPPNVAEPLYYVINAYYEMDGQTSGPVSVRVYR